MEDVTAITASVVSAKHHAGLKINLNHNIHHTQVYIINAHQPTSLICTYTLICLNRFFLSAMASGQLQKCYSINSYSVHFT